MRVGAKSPTLILLGEVFCKVDLVEFMESKMRHHSNSPTENMHALLECIIIEYANGLRAKYLGRKIP